LNFGASEAIEAHQYNLAEKKSYEVVDVAVIPINSSIFSEVVLKV
jgi:hypothetical protein